MEHQGGSERGRSEAPGGGRCMRARELARRRAGGEELEDYETRVLDAHLSGCGRCRRYVASLAAKAPVAPEQATVVAGEAPPTGVKVGSVEAATPSPETEVSHAPSHVDAMGKDKRRQVIGHAYGPTRARQLTYYGVFVAIVLALFFGAKFAIDELDKAPEKIENQSPWSKGDAPQVPPQRFQ
jgi:hypothetical protein